MQQGRGPKGFNRAENVRAIPPETQKYVACYPFRSSSEGDNRRIDDNLPLRRARSYGRQGQLLDLVGHALNVNSLGRYLWGSKGTRRRELDGSPPATRAA